MSGSAPQEPRHDGGRWETIRYALDSNVCKNELMAYRMADWLAGATEGYGDLAWFEENGTMGLSGLLLAASMTGASMAEVYRWRTAAATNAPWLPSPSTATPNCTPWSAR